LNKLRPGSELPEDLEKLYVTPFTGHEAYRNRIWQVLTSEFFSRWVDNSSTVLDLGCGYGEFLNNVSAGKKYAMDLNPSTKDQLRGDVEFQEQDCSLPWPFPDHSLSIVFTIRSKPTAEAKAAPYPPCWGWPEAPTADGYPVRDPPFRDRLRSPAAQSSECCKLRPSWPALRA
jgi:hypothetical protein